MSSTIPTSTRFRSVPAKRRVIETPGETRALNDFRRTNSDLFEKSDLRLALHLVSVLTLLAITTCLIVTTPMIWLKIVLGPVAAFFWFSLGNVTVHHHHTHHNAAKSATSRRLLNILHFFVVPDGGRHLKRYRRAHMNHHTNPLHHTDVDHLYSLHHHHQMSSSLVRRVLYYLELTFLGGHMPGPKDEAYINKKPISSWNLADYQQVKQREVQKSVRNGLIAWALFVLGAYLIPPLAWGWLYPLLLVKNWSGFLGQFQHFDIALLDPHRTRNNRTKTFRVPGWFNYLAAGEISGHFLHHIYPDMPYYHVERARRRFMQQPELVRLVVNH